MAKTWEEVTEEIKALEKVNSLNCMHKNYTSEKGESFASHDLITCFCTDCGTSWIDYVAKD